MCSDAQSELTGHRAWPASSAVPLRPGGQLLLLAVTVAVSQFALTALGPLQESIRSTLGLTDTQMALLQGPTRALPLVLAGVPLGLIIDRRSRVRLLWLFAWLNVLANVSTALAPDFAVLFAARCIAGLAGAAILTAAVSLIADLYPPEQRGRATMAIGIGQVAGSSAAFAAGGELLVFAGAGHGSWHWAMLWLTCPLIGILPVMLAMREPPRTGYSIREPSARQSLKELWQYRAVLAPLLGGVVVVDIAFGGAYIWAAPVFSRNFGLSPARIGAIMATTLLIGGIIGPVTGGVLADLCQRTGGPRRTSFAISALAFLSIPTGLFAVASSVTSASISLLVFLTTVPTISLMVTTLCMVVIPNELRGLCIVVLNALSVSFAYFVAPLAVSLLSEAIGGPRMIGTSVSVVCVTASVMGAVTFALGTRGLSNVAVR